MTRPNISAIRERCEAVSEGEWVSYEAIRFSHLRAYSVRRENGAVEVAGDLFRVDADFIAHARQDIPALLDYIAEIEGSSDD